MIGDDIRRQLVAFARRPRDRISKWTRARPTDWRPESVNRPNAPFDSTFRDATAWDLIASKLEEGHAVEVIELRRPSGAKGYVMHIDIEAGRPQIYVKLELAGRKVFGRSFHYSEKRMSTK